jgi:hypothetical protein
MAETTVSPLSNDSQAKVDAANYNRTMETMQQISMENSMRQMRYQTQQAMMSGEVTMNAHLANAHITNIDTLGKIMNKGYNKANSAIQSQ